MNRRALLLALGRAVSRNKLKLGAGLGAVSGAARGEQTSYDEGGDIPERVTSAALGGLSGAGIGAAMPLAMGAGGVGMAPLMGTNNGNGAAYLLRRLRSDEQREAAAKRKKARARRSRKKPTGSFSVVDASDD